MGYNYYLEIATVVLMLTLSVDIRHKKQLYRLDTRIFANTLLYLAGLSLCNYMSCIGLLYTDIVPIWVNTLLAMLYFVMQALVIFGIVRFIIAYPNNSFRGHEKMANAALAAFCLNLLFSVTSVWTKFYFYIDESGVYHHGRFRMIGYAFYLLALAMVIAFVYANRHSFIKQDVFVLVFSMILLSVAVIFQMYNHLSLVIDFVTGVCLLIVYITMQNPSFYIDKTTGCNSHEALRQFMNNWNPRHDEYHVVMLGTRGNRKMLQGLSYDDALELGRNLSQFMQELTMEDDWLFVLAEGDFAIVTRSEENREWYVHALEGRFERSLKMHNGSNILIKREIAVCSYPAHFTDFNSLVDLGHHMTKALLLDTKNGVIYADDQVAEKRQRFEAVEEALQKVIAEELLDVYYQPIYNIKTRKIVALEALSRINYSSLGQIPPMEFIKVAEATGLIYDLGLLVMKNVCRFIKNKLSNIPNSSVEFIEVNLSPLQLMNEKTIENIRNILNEYEVDPHIIKFEITESATADSPEIVENAMKELLELGCFFALDDYGTGYSNINYLVRFPFKDVKFDKDLIWSYFKDESAHIIMEGEFRIIQELGKCVIAEGIEDENQMYELSESGVTCFQGYYFSKPLPENECITYLLRPKPEKRFRN